MYFPISTVRIRLLPGIIAFALMSTVSPAIFAQDDDGVSALEEVMVTATKREESTQDIAMSVQVLSGDSLQAMSIDNLDDMSAIVPNFTMGDTLTVSQITMRGVGSGEDRGFEQSVSMFKDGIYLPRSRQTRSPFFDVDRVEVLRGPQAVLFGLNSTAGAISIHGAVNRPGDDFQATVTGEYEMEQGGYRGRVTAGGSAGDTLGWRIAVEGLDSGDGWLLNDIAGDQGSTEHTLARISLVWEPTDNLSFTARYEYNDATTDGQATEVANGELNLAGDGATGGLLQRFATINAIIPGSWETGGEDSVFDYRGFHDEDVYFQSLHDGVDTKNYRDPLGADQQIDNLSVSMDWSLGEYTLTGLFGYSDYSYDAAVNISGLTESFYYGTNYEEYEQTSFELRLASPLGNTIEWIAGAYYHDAEMFTDQPNTFDVGKFFGIFLGLPPAIVEAAVLGAPLLELAGATLSQDTSLFSPFISATWNISDRFRVTGGVRYSDQKKDYDRDAATPGSGLYLKLPDGSLGPFLGGAILNANGASVGKTSGTVDSSNTMPELMAEWDMGDSAMLFVRYAESAKAGGVATAGSAALSGLIYDDEKAESFEIGLKSRFLDGRAELNVTVFSTDFTDLQVKSSEVAESGVITVINNAGQATSEGIEIDGRFAATDWLVLGGNVAWLDAKYDDYAAGPCNRSLSTTPGEIAGTCDLSGEKLPFAADYSGSIFANIDANLGSSLRFLGNLTVAFSDSYAVEGTLEPSLVQDSWTRLSGRIGIADLDNRWSVSLIGQNLTDEKVWAGGQPLFGYAMVYPTMPRTITLQGVYRF
jgi:outer membrane receptor protein involved in Fe transport